MWKFNEQQYGIETLRKYEKFNKDYEYEKFTYYYDLATLFREVDFDSACVNYVKSYKIAQSKNIKSNFIKYVKQKKKWYWRQSSFWKIIQWNTIF